MRELVARGGQLSAAAEVAPKAAHGRREVRLLWALADPALNAYAGSSGEARVPWPHLGQVCRLERRRTLRQNGQWHTEVEVRYCITSREPAQADAAALLRATRGHWGIENKVHWVRDVTFDEDRCQVRAGAAPEVLAACRNVVLTLVRRTGVTNIAAALRTHAGRPRVAVQLVTSAGRG